MSGFIKSRLGTLPRCKMFMSHGHSRQCWNRGLMLRDVSGLKQNKLLEDPRVHKDVNEPPPPPRGLNVFSKAKRTRDTSVSTTGRLFPSKVYAKTTGLFPAGRGVGKPASWFLISRLFSTTPTQSSWLLFSAYVCRVFNSITTTSVVEVWLVMFFLLAPPRKAEKKRYSDEKIITTDPPPNLPNFLDFRLRRISTRAG